MVNMWLGSTTWVLLTVRLQHVYNHGFCRNECHLRLCWWREGDDDHIRLYLGLGVLFSSCFPPSPLSLLYTLCRVPFCVLRVQVWTEESPQLMRIACYAYTPGNSAPIRGGHVTTCSKALSRTMVFVGLRFHYYFVFSLYPVKNESFFFSPTKQNT